MVIANTYQAITICPILFMHLTWVISLNASSSQYELMVFSRDTREQI